MTVWPCPSCRGHMWCDVCVTGQHNSISISSECDNWGSTSRSALLQKTSLTHTHTHTHTHSLTHTMYQFNWFSFISPLFPLYISFLPLYIVKIFSVEAEAETQQFSSSLVSFFFSMKHLWCHLLLSLKCNGVSAKLPACPGVFSAGFQLTKRHRGV